MLVCDRCLGKKASALAVSFRKFDGSNRLGREMIKATATLCEPCIDELLKSFGRFKKQFMSEPNRPDAGPENKVERGEKECTA